MESLTVVVFAVSALTEHAGFSLLREGPVARDFLVVLKSDLDSLASVDADAFEVKRLWEESEFGDGHVCDELNRVLRPILDIDRDLVALLAKLGCLSRGEDNVEVLTGIRKQIGHLIRLNV